MTSPRSFVTKRTFLLTIVLIIVLHVLLSHHLQLVETPNYLEQRANSKWHHPEAPGRVFWKVPLSSTASAGTLASTGNVSNGALGMTFCSGTSNTTDADGIPCLAIKGVTSRQMIYRVTTPDITYMYCGIPKNGCTVHIGIMHRILRRKYEGGGNIHPAQQQIDINLDRNLDEFNRLLNDHKVRKYLIVRNPLERVLSAYIDKVERWQRDELKTPATFARWAYDNLQPGMKWEKINPHWRAQSTMCGFSIADIHTHFKLFRAENGQEIVDYLHNFLPERVTKDGWGGAWNKSLREFMLGPWKRTGNTNTKFEEYVGGGGGLKLFDHLTEVYAEDIERLKYEREVAELRKRVEKWVALHKKATP